MELKNIYQQHYSTLLIFLNDLTKDFV